MATPKLSQVPKLNDPTDEIEGRNALSPALEADIEGVMEVFSQRLNERLDKTDFPSVNAGRYTSLGDKYNTSRQQAYRWCTGKALPNPAILIRMADELGTTIDELFGGTTAQKGGVRIPIFRLADPDIEATNSNFVEDGYINAPAQSIAGVRRMAVLRNWNESTNPAFNEGDDLFVDLTVRQITPNGTYVTRTATTTSIRTAEVELTGTGDQRVKFYRNTPINKFSTTYLSEEIHYNAAQRFDIEWKQSGVLIIGRVVGFMRSTTPGITSLLL